MYRESGVILEWSWMGGVWRGERKIQLIQFLMAAPFVFMLVHKAAVVAAASLRAG